MIYRFGPFELDEAAGELRREGKAVAIQPKPLALLTLLIEERHRIVPNDELLDRLWPGETVTPNSLSRAVSVARSAIGDSGRSLRIRSYTRRGYRFHDQVVELDATDLAETGPTDDAPEPEPLAGGMPFVGREEALARLRATWNRSARGRGGIVVVSGPPGIGKSRLAEVFAAEVERRGGLALRGRALEEEGEPAFWVWAQVLRALREADPACLDVPGLADSGELAHLLPELGASETGAAGGLPEEQRRFVFFDAVVRALRRAARSRPLLVVFEDLHWADPASLKLLEHLAFELAGTPVLLLATAREESPDRGDVSYRTLSLLRRQERYESVALAGLDTAEVERLVERVLGRRVPELAERLRVRTEGVPLFLREAFRRLAEQGALDDPDAVASEIPLAPADWVRDALAELSVPCASLVGAAAVVGRELALPLVAATAGISRDEALDLLDEAVAAGVVEADPASPIRYRFVHDLFRESAYDALSPGSLVRMHHRAALQLERQHEREPDRVVAELAHHHHRALAVTDPERALACAQRAAERASEARAYEQAARHWNQALAALGHLETSDPERRLKALLGLGEASRLSGERELRRRHFGEALSLARSLEQHESFAAAAIGLCDLAEWGVRDELARQALQEALERLDEPAAELEARILTRLGYLDSLFDRPGAEAHLRRAVQIARELGASDPLEEALYALHFLLGGPEGLKERSEILDELRGAASAARDPVASVIAVLDVACDSLELGDPARAVALRREADTTAGQPPHPRTTWHRLVYDTGLALLEGRLGEVEGRAEEARALGRRIQHPYAAGCHDVHVAFLARETGAWQDVLALLEPTLQAHQGPTEWVKALVIRARLALGRHDEALALYRELATKGFAAIPRNLRWIATLVEIAHACAGLDDARGAEELRELLAPFEHHHGVMPMVICYGGPVGFALARLAEVQGRADEAAELYPEAVAAAGELGARPNVARILLAHGSFLRRRGQRAAAREQLSAAAALAADLGLSTLERAAAEELATAS